MSYSTSDLIDNIKNKSFIPTDQTTFTELRLLQIANDELKSMLLPLVLSVREEHFVVEKEFTINANQKEYRIPYRSIGNSLRDVSLVTSSSSHSLPRLDPAVDILDRTGRQDTEGFYLQGPYVVLYPTPSSSTTNKLRFTFHLQPSDLVKLTETASVSSFDSVTKTVTVDSLPVGISSSTPIDLISKDSPYSPILFDQSATIVGNQITFSNDLPPDVQVGDYIALAGKSPFPQIPQELIPILEQRVIVKVYEALGDHSAMEYAQLKVNELEKRILNLLTPRVSGELPVINQTIWD